MAGLSMVSGNNVDDTRGRRTRCTVSTARLTASTDVYTGRESIDQHQNSEPLSNLDLNEREAFKLEVEDELVRK